MTDLEESRAAADGQPTASDQPTASSRPTASGGPTAPGESWPGPSVGRPDGPGRVRPWVPWAVAGLAAGMVGLGVAQLVAALVGPASAPLAATGSAFVDRTPSWLKNLAVALFGTHDKQVLFGGAALVLGVLSVLAGLLARRRRRPAQWFVLALGLLAGLAAATRPNASAASLLPSLMGAVAGAFTLTWLARRAGSGVAGSAAVPPPGTGAPPVPETGAPPVPETGAPPGTGAAGDPGRREAVRLGGLTFAGGAVTWAAGWVFGRDLYATEAAREAVRLPAPVSPAPPLPTGVDLGVRGVAPYRVPNADFYRIDTALLTPRLDVASWQLRVHGLVGQELTLSFAQLLRSGLVERDVTLACVSNEVGGDLIGNARWLGLPLGPLLRRAGLHPDADMVLSTSADGWTAGTPLAVLLDGRDAMLAVGMNGVPLPVEHGFPVRMVVPGLYGYVSATKWVVDLEVTRFDRASAYWTTRGWSDRGPVKTQSRIDVPKDGAQVGAGRVAVAGVAWAQHRGIARVEVRVDDGPWQAARLAAVPSADTWRQWVLPWDAARGRHRIQVRAVDGSGAVQTGEQAPPEPDGATGWHTVTVDVL